MGSSEAAAALPLGGPAGEPGEAPPTFIGIHLPKCAGTTLRTRVASCLPADAVYQNSSMAENFHRRRPEFLDIAEPARLRFVFGHSVQEEMLRLFPNPILFTGLREPAARLKSHVVFLARVRKWQGRPVDVAALARAANPMCTLIANCFPTLARRRGPDSPFEKARRVLEACSFVYFMHSFEKTAEQLFRALGIAPERVDENVAPENAEVDVDESLFDIAEDRRLYDWALERFGDADAGAAIAAGSKVPRWFLRTPPRLGELRAFLTRRQAEQYRQWGLLDAVIARKSAALANLQAELDAFAAVRWAAEARAPADPAWKEDFWRHPPGSHPDMSAPQ